MDLEKKINKASKWSLITELLSKLMAPIVNMVLARLLTPEAFGMVATITMVTSFADIITDAGFQKYLIQEEFASEDELDKSTNVAFWTNLSIAVILWTLIICFRHPLAKAVGNAGLGNALAVASAVIPMTAFSSIQMARYRREFDFKTLFFAKSLGIFIPLLVTVPLAFVLKSFWALVIGNLAIQFSYAVLLTLRSKWKPRLFYSLKMMKEMLSFSLWALLERILGWTNLNVGIFVVGHYLSEYYLGLYKTSMATTNQIMAIIVNALSPVILSTLSRLKCVENEYREMFYNFEERISLVILPLGIGIFVFKDLVTKVMLGNQWTEAAMFIGIWALVRSLYIVFGSFSMEVCVSQGKPKYSVLSQTLILIILLPTLLCFAKRGYQPLYIARSLVVFWSMAVDLTLLKTVAGISPVKILNVCVPQLVISISMGIVGLLLLRINESIVWQFAAVVICIVYYFGVAALFPKTRKTINDVRKMVSGK